MSTLAHIPPHVTAVLQVNLDAIANNYNQLKAIIAPHCDIAGMLKANSYGLGAQRVGQRLYQEGCRIFFFAYLDEAIKGRKDLPYDDAKIIVLNGVFKDTEELFIQYNLTPALISLDQVNRWWTYAKKRDLKLACLLHVDTGMGREGLSVKEFQHFVDHKQDYISYLDVVYLMSHLSNSNNAMDAKNKLQYDRFMNYRRQMPEVKASLLSSEIRCTLVNSSGMALGNEFHFDLVRPGLAIYGYKSAWGDFTPLEPSVAAFGRILLTRDLPIGETIGYQGIFECHEPTRIALISVGHSDGILRCASNVGYVKINGLKATIIGRVSMDMMMVNITQHPENSVQAGDWATLYDDAKTMHDFAENEQTSVYEVLVRHGQRFHRIYKERS